VNRKTPVPSPGKKYQDKKVPNRVFIVLRIEEGYAVVDWDGIQFTAELEDFNSGRYKEVHK
jgi:hypothetical protein